LINFTGDKIGIKNHPFLFLLCFVDTIDPSKKSKDIIFSFQNLFFCTNDSRLILKDQNSIIRKSVLSLTTWLKVDIKQIMDKLFIYL